MLSWERTFTTPQNTANSCSLLQTISALTSVKAFEDKMKVRCFCDIFHSTPHNVMILNKYAKTFHNALVKYAVVVSPGHGNEISHFTAVYSVYN